MIGVSGRHMYSRPVGNRQQFRHARPALAPLDPGQPFAQCIGDDARHALPGRLCYGLRQPMGLRVLDIETHDAPF